MALTVLLTGFGPFPGAHDNPTAALVAQLVRRRRPLGSDVRRVAHVFETCYGAVDADLPALIEQYRPDAIAMFGLAARTPHLRIEAQARNRLLTSFPDAGGHRPLCSAITPGTLSHLPGRAPMHKLVAGVRALGLPAALSRNAGRYVCNYAYWQALVAAGEPGGPRVVVFVHVPTPHREPPRRKPSQRKTVSRDDLVRAGDAILTEVIAAAQRHR